MEEKPRNLGGGHTLVCLLCKIGSLVSFYIVHLAYVTQISDLQTVVGDSTAGGLWKSKLKYTIFFIKNVKYICMIYNFISVYS